VLILVRHGQTAANASGLLLGRLDVELDERGREQAARLAAVVGRPGVRVVSSPLRRARDTAAAIAASAGTTVEVDERWVEIDYGSHDGTPLSEVPAQLWACWREDPDFAPEGGESLAAVGRRVAAACEALAPGAAAGDVVVVSHVSPIKAAVVWALGTATPTVWRMFVAVASVTRIAIGDRGPVLHSFNETAHLR
jgi:broad specificity phosphatase PhoE